MHVVSKENEAGTHEPCAKWTFITKWIFFLINAKSQLVLLTSLE